MNLLSAIFGGASLRRRRKEASRRLMRLWKIQWIEHLEDMHMKELRAMGLNVAVKETKRAKWCKSEYEK